MAPVVSVCDASHPRPVALEDAAQVCQGGQECLAVAETSVAPVAYTALEYVADEAVLVALVAFGAAAAAAAVGKAHFVDEGVALVANALAA